MEQFQTALAEILDQTQRTFAAHSKGLKQFKRLYKTSPNKFRMVFTPMLNKILFAPKGESSAERLVKFIASAACSLEQANHVGSGDSQPSQISQEESGRRI
jgi:hypothetical protein